MVMVYVLVVMGILLLLGYVYLLSRQAAARVRYFCDSCERYLGTGISRDRVCPNCGDNRYYTRKESDT
jgi:rubrerythrin